LVVKQWEQIVELQRMVAALRDEIARLKGGPGRPNLKPSGMERGTEPPGSCSEGKRPTVPRLVTLLRSLGVVISKRQVVRLLIEGQDGFLAEARDVLRAGLLSAAWALRGCSRTRRMRERGTSIE
jgi:hypothetical protein